MTINDISLYEAGVLRFECSRCHTIFKYSKEPIICPKCTGPISNEIFPPLPALDIFYTLFELYDEAKTRQKEIVERLNKRLFEITGQDYSDDRINNILSEIVSLQNNTEFIEIEKNEKIKTKIKHHLKLSDMGQINKVFHVLVHINNHNRLCKPMFILSASVIEIIFKSFMEDAITKMTNANIAKNIMSTVNQKGIEEHIKQFQILIKDEFEINFKDPFFTSWNTLRRQRNQIIHKNSFHLHWERTKKVFELAEKSVDVFAELNNKIITKH